MRRDLLHRYLFGAALLCSAAFSPAEIRYTVKPLPQENLLRITISFPAQAGATELQIPNWGPGSYRFVDNYRNVADFKAAEAGADLKIEKPNDYTWRVTTPSAGEVSVNYTLRGQLADGAMHYGGPATYMYVVGRKDETCTLALDVSGDWKVACGLDETRGKKNAFSAPTYDVLADNPVTMGDFILDAYTVRGKPHYIAYRGANRANIDREYVKKFCSFISTSLGDFWGGLPYSKYVWHFAVTPNADGGGGLEHLSSTQITLAVGAGPRCVHVCAHEFFHLWNVKRLRAKVLGPFDYTQLPQTGALWLQEGVTDYYASLLMFRYGWWDENEFWSHIVRNVTNVRNNSARLEVSPNEASMRVSEAANGRGNSNGYRISYYDLGWVAGLCLDIEIRAQSGGNHSLDDVVHALNAMCKNGQPGFEEDEIRKQCIRFGGPSLGDFYDRVIMKPGELPVEEQLAKVGLGMDSRVNRSVDPLFDWMARGVDPAPRVVRVRGDAASKLKADDYVLSIGGVSCEGKGTQQISERTGAVLAALKEGAPTKLKVKRGDETLEVEITPVGRAPSGLRVGFGDLSDRSKRDQRMKWYYGNSGAPPKR